MSTPCQACGNNMEAADRFCRVCGWQVPAAPYAPPPPFSGPASTSGKALTSLIFGLFFFFFPFSIIAIIFGHLALSEIRRSGGRLQGNGLAIAGLVLGYGGVVFIPFILIIAAIAIPNLMRARMATNESSAVATVRTVETAELAYVEKHPEEGYTCSLSSLAEAGLISGALATGSKSGYTFQLSGCSADPGATANSHYEILAYPTVWNQSGVRTFCADESGIVKAERRRSAEKCMESGSRLD